MSDVRLPGSSSSSSTTQQLIPVFQIYLSNRSSRFDFLRIGPLCNGSRNLCFTDAFCDLEQIESPRLKGVPLSVNMSVLFDRAFEVLQAQVSERDIQLSDKETKALTDLRIFLQNIDTHERNILNAYKEMTTEQEKKTVFCMALVEHLFSQLASNNSYSIDARSQGKGANKQTCKCGCDRPVHFDATGIGHNKVWHGYADIMIRENQEGDPVGTVKVVTDPKLIDAGENVGPTTSKRKRAEDDDCPGLSSPHDDSTSDDSTSDVQSKIRRNWDHAVAQTIVFALAKKQRHQEIRHFVPTVLICQEQFYIIMYEPESDVLIWSGGFRLWSTLSPTNFNKYAVIALWMVSHHELFCAGSDIFENVHEVKAGFLNRIEKEKKEFYKDLAIGVAKFETEERDFMLRGHTVSDMFENVKVKLKKQ